MRIRFVFKQNGRLIHSVYTLEQIEDGSLPRNLKLLKQDLEVIRRDIGSGVMDKRGYIEIFENDIIATSDKRGRVKFEKGIFHLKGIPVKDLKEPFVVEVGGE